MGMVWVAHDEGRGNDVAVKFLRTTRRRSSAARDRFAFEARVPTMLRTSPHIVAVLESGTTDDGSPFLIMELLRGADLGVYLRRATTLSPEAVVAIVRQIASALGLAHEKGIIHRDIKPSNIFLCEGPKIFCKLLDFGIAKESRLLQSLRTSSSVMVGTPHYMSPEQLLGHRRLDAGVDIWALGVLVFRALTGRRPFHGDTVGALTLSIMGAPIPKATMYAPSLGERFDRWFFRACAIDPKERFASALKAADSLAEALDVTSAAEQQATLPALGSVMAAHAASDRGSVQGLAGDLASHDATFTHQPPARPLKWSVRVVASAAVGVSLVAGGIATSFRRPETLASVPSPSPPAASSPSTSPKAEPPHADLAAPGEPPPPAPPASSPAPSESTGALPTASVVPRPRTPAPTRRQPAPTTAAKHENESSVDTFHMPAERF